MTTAYGPEPEQRLEVASGAGERMPLAIVVPGGGWLHGRISLTRSVQHGLASRGVIAVAIGYSARQPDPVADMLASLRLAVARVVAGDPVPEGAWDGSVTLVGDSAGGHAALLASLADERVDRVATLCGALSLEALLHPATDDERARFPGYLASIHGHGDGPASLEAVDPLAVRRAGGRAVPLFAATSAGDFFAASTTAYVDAARALGDDVTAYVEPSRERTHSWFLDESLPETASLLDALAAWLRTPRSGS